MNFGAAVALGVAVELSRLARAGVDLVGHAVTIGVGLVLHVEGVVEAWRARVRVGEAEGAPEEGDAAEIGGVAAGEAGAQARAGVDLAGGRWKYIRPLTCHSRGLVSRSPVLPLPAPMPPKSSAPTRMVPLRRGTSPRS